MRQVILPFILFALIHTACSQNIQLPDPDKTGGIPLMQALSERQTTREFADKALSLQDVSDLCWAAWGFNRTDKRTAPSSQNKQEMLLYVFMEKGIYLYNAENHILEMVKKGDFRAASGIQDFVGSAALNFVYVSDMAKAGYETQADITPERLIPSHANSGFMAQNVYLVAASKGLGSVIRAWIDADDIRTLLELNEMKAPLYGQSVGHKK